MNSKKFLFGFISVFVLLITFSFVAIANKEYEKDFSDVEMDNWFYTPVMELSEKGIINGYGDGTFGAINSISRAEVAKLLYEVDFALNEKIAELEARIVYLESNDNTDTDADETSVFDTNGEDDDAAQEEEIEQLVMNISVDLTGNKTMPDAYALFEELSSQKFQFYYPKNLFWNNTFGGLEDADGYVWYIALGNADFDLMDEEEMLKNARMAVSVVYPDEVVSDSEVLIFIAKDADTSYLVEGNLADLQSLQKIAVSIKKITN